MNMKKPLFPCLAFILGGLLAAAPSAEAASRGDESSALIERESVRRIEGEVSGSICFEHVRKLSGYDRRWGSRDYAEAISYLAGKSRDYGLRDVSIERVSIRTGRETFWMQSPGGYVPWECRRGSLRLVKPFPMLISDYESASSTVADHSRSTETEAELVFVGKGDSAKDYEGLDVRGKIVLSEGGNHEEVHELAVQRHGALGTVLFYPFPAQSPESDGVYWTRILPMSRDGKARSTFGFSLSTNRGMFLRDMLKKGEKIVVAAEIDADIVPDGTFDLLTAVIPGSTAPEEEFLLYSHLDHPKPGAHDNAGSNATVLEIARTLSVLVQKGILPRPSRTIRFLWMPHMSGLNMYLSRHPEKIGKIKAGINLDCVGLNQSKYPSFFYVVLPPASLLGPLTDITNNLVDLFNRRLSRAFVEGSQQGFLVAPEGSRNMFQATLLPYDGGSDEYTANTTSLNIPSLRFFDFPIPPRHNQLDVLEYIDPTTLQRVSYLGAIVAYAYAGMGPKTAPYLLNENLYQAKDRLAQDLLKAENLIESAGPDAIHESYRRGILLLRWRAETEQKGLTALRNGAAFDGSLDERLADDRRGMEACAASSLAELTKRHGAVCRRLNVRPLKGTLGTPDSPWASVIPVPNPEIKGSPGYFDTYFEDTLGPNYLKKYPNILHYFAYGSTGYYETLNYMDGKRSVLDIYEAVRAELWSGDYSFSHSLSLEETAEYVRLLNDARVISLKKR
jgi:hypothetical protein